MKTRMQVAQMSVRELFLEGKRAWHDFNRIKQAQELISGVAGCDKVNNALGVVRQSAHDYATVIDNEVIARLKNFEESHVGRR